MNQWLIYLLIFFLLSNVIFAKSLKTHKIRRIAAKKSDESSVGIEGGIAVARKFLSSRGVANLANLAIRVAPALFRGTRKMIMTPLRVAAESAARHLSNFLGFLASSHSTNLIYMRETSSHYNSEGKPQRNRRSIASMVSGAFMMPFKMAFGSVRSMPIRKIYAYLISMIPFIDVISEHRVVQSMSSSTAMMLENLVERLWHMTKAYILPSIDKVITQLHKSNTLPKSVMLYLDQLQSFYHVCHTFGVL